MGADGIRMKEQETGINDKGMPTRVKQ